MAFGAPLYSLNLGYSGEDWVGVVYCSDLVAHLQNHWAEFDPQGYNPAQLLSPQNVATISFSPDTLTTMTNLFLSYNPISGLDLHGAPAIREVECYGCPNLKRVDVSGSPNLWRACFENCAVQGTLDFTGCTNLCDIRGANNQLQGLVLDDAGPTISHLCVRDNPTLSTLSVSNLYSLRDFYIWNCNQQWPITSATLPSGKLYDVEIYSNRFESVDVSGQTNLVWLWAHHNNLTNVLLTNCSSLYEVLLNDNQMESNALDNVLAALDASSSVPHTVDLRGNVAYPSTSVGWQHYTNLIARQQAIWATGATIYCDWPANWPPASPVDLGGGWTLRQSQTSQSAHASTFASANEAGNLLVCFSRDYQNDCPADGVPTDTAGNAWHSVTSSSVTYDAYGGGHPQSGHMRVWYCTNCAASANNSVTLPFGAGDNTSLWISEWSGAALANVIDSSVSVGDQSSSSSGADNVFCGPLIPLSDNGLVLAFAAYASGPGIAGTNFTAIHPQAGGFGEYYRQETAATLYPSMTSGHGSGETFGMIAVAFKHQ